MSGNILFSGKKIFEIPPFFQTRPGDLGKKVHACSLRFSALNVLSVQRSLLRDQSQASVVQRQDSAIHRINLYPVDSVICFPNTYRLDSDLSDR